MTDRELLELAAKAAKYEYKINSVYPAYAGDPNFEVFLRNRRVTRQRDWTAWNPLTDDGDALRLMVMLGINVRFSLCGDFVSAACPFKGPEENVGDDPCAATRRAIARAAAEIGKEMK